MWFVCFGIYTECVVILDVIRRFSGEFIDTFKHSVTAVFLWTLLTICSSLLVLKSELVEYLMCDYRIDWAFYLIHLFLAVKWRRTVGMDWAIGLRYLVIHWHFLHLWNGRTVDHFIWTIRRWFAILQLVFISNRSTTNVLDRTVKFTESCNDSRTWKPFLHPVRIQKGNFHVNFSNIISGVLRFVMRIFYI